MSGMTVSSNDDSRFIIPRFFFQPGTTISQADDGTIYITHADGTTTPLNAATQQAVQMETVESLLSLDGQQPETWKMSAI